MAGRGRRTGPSSITSLLPIGSCVSIPWLVPGPERTLSPAAPVATFVPAV